MFLNYNQFFYFRLIIYYVERIGSYTYGVSFNKINSENYNSFVVCLFISAEPAQD